MPNNNRWRLDVPTKRGTVLNGVLFRETEERTADTVMIAITGIHGNFYSNPFYYNIGDTLNAAGIDFIYAQTNDAFGEIETFNVRTKKKELIGLWNERFCYTDEDIDAYLTFAAEAGYRHMVITFNYKDGSKTITFEKIENAINGSDLTDFAAPSRRKHCIACGDFFFVGIRRRIMRHSFPVSDYLLLFSCNPFSTLL